MAKSVTISNLAAEIVQAVKEYTEDVAEAVAQEVDATSKAVLDDIQAASPVKSGEYKKGWRRTESETGSGRIRYIIHQKKKPQLVHLLELGHAKRDGGRVEGKPHLRPAYDRHVPQMVERIKRIIRNGGRA